MLAGELDAAVAPDNSVVTLVLDTGLGLYVRYSGDWQLLPDDSSSLEGVAIHPVDPRAVDIFDAADAAAQSITIFDLPRSVDNTYTDVSDREEAEPRPTGPVVAAIDNIADLSNIALMPASGAWYARKRAEALAPKRRDPEVLVAAGAFLRSVQDGGNPDPTGILRRDLIRRARAAGMLDHPTIMAAINWRDWLHPRGRDGRFIHKAGWVNVFDSPTKGTLETPRRGKVRELTQRGVVVDLYEGGKPSGQQVTVNANLIEDFKPAASLNPAEGGEGVAAGALTARFRNAYRDLTKDIPFASANKVTDEPLTDEELDEHRKFLDEVNTRIDRDRLSMESLMKDPQGRWEDEFYDWMLDTVEEVYDQKYADRPKDRKALVTGGLGGAGKSTTLDRLSAAGVIDSKEWITINPDDMKEEMIARGMFPEIEGLAPAEMANILHGVSSEMAHLLGERAMSEGHNVIFDITMGGGITRLEDGTWGTRASSVIGDITGHGYSDIDAIFVDIPIEKSVEQAMGRHRRGLERLRAGESSEGGRYVPARIIEDNAYTPGPDGKPNPLSFGLTNWTTSGKKVTTPYADRYGTTVPDRNLADQADAVREAIFSATEGSAGAVDTLLADFETMTSVFPHPRAQEELAALQQEWGFLDPRVSGTAPSERFQSLNAYNFARVIHDGGPIGDWAIYDNTDLDNQKTVSATGKYEGVELRPVRRREQTGPMLDGLPAAADRDRVIEIMDGLESGTHELTASPTSDADAKFRLHTAMVHSDEIDHTPWIEYETEEARDAALIQAQELQQRSIEQRAEKVSAFGQTDPEIEVLANGLVEPGPRGTRSESLRSRVKMSKRLESVKMPDGSWALRDTLSGAIVGQSADQETIVTRRTKILNALYPPLG